VPLHQLTFLEHVRVRSSEEILQALTSDVLHASTELLGCVLVRGGRRARIVEVEAYRAEDDEASHAHRSRTRRNEVMFGPPGRAYVYFNYGVHWMLNVTAHPEDRAAAILVRAVEPLDGVEEMMAMRPKAKDPRELLSGPGKLAAAFEITGLDNGIELFNAESELRLEPGERVTNFVQGPRIGIKVAQELPWRFADADALEWCSKPPPPRWS
jgi:DNA-3-methyladenine glycosylase